VFTKAVVDAADKAVQQVESGRSESPAPTAGAEPSSAGDQAEEPPAGAEYAVTIDSARTVKDYKGNPVMIVDFTFTNNSDKDANFMFAVSAKAFQDGVELSDSYGVDDPDYDVEAGMKDIKPGASLKVQDAWELTGTTPVTVECSELISWDDTLLASKEFPVE
jgi:hypothetical protein